MGAIVSQITSLTIIYSVDYSGAYQSKHQSSASLTFVRGIHRGPVNSPHKWPVTRKMSPFDDVIMRYWHFEQYTITHTAVNRVAQTLSNIGKKIKPTKPLQWRHNERDGVSNHQPHQCILNGLFRHRSTKTSKLLVTGLCEGKSPVTDEFPAQRASSAENISFWWRHYDVCVLYFHILQLIRQCMEGPRTRYVLYAEHQLINVSMHISVIHVCTGVYWNSSRVTLCQELFENDVIDLYTSCYTNNWVASESFVTSFNLKCVWNYLTFILPRTDQAR